MTPQELKSSILQLAFQGKLVEQRLEEGTAEEIISLCRDDKARSIREGKCKKEAFRGAITNNDYFPFEIPESWIWMFISDMSLFQEGPGILAVNFRSEGVPLIRIAGMQSDIVSLEGCNYLDEEMVASKWSHFRLDLGDIVVSTSASMDKIAEVTEECVGAIPYTGLIRFKMYGGIDKNYFKWFIKSPCYRKQVDEHKAGGTIKHYGPSHLRKMIIPLPPLAEQKRIVAKIEELLPYVERYEQAWNKLEELNKRFPIDLQKSILQMAIQGKLVEQRPEEGTGEELYQQIQAEKQRLIKEGKIKKEKPLPEITEDEIPFDIPENWKWARFGELGNYKKGPFGSALTKGMFVPKGNGAVKVYEQKNAIQKNANIGDYYITREYFETKMSGFEVQPGDVIVSCAGTIGETYVLPENIEQGIINQALMRMQLFQPIYVPYFLVYFDVVLKQNARLGSKGSAIKNIPPFKVLKSYPVPLPPLAEQQRIVTKLEEILPLCEKLKK